MPAGKKISAQMSTSIALDTLKASESLKSLNKAITGTTNAWKAQANALKTAGDAQGSLQAKINGLKNVQEAELQKIQALINKQKDLDLTTQKGAQQYMKYQSQIDRTVSAYEKQTVQINKSKQALGYYSSGLSKLQQEYRRNNQVSQSYVNRLKAEGNEYQATATRIKQLQSNYQNLSNQYKIQADELNKIAQSSGKASEAYQKQATRLNETATKMEKAKTEQKELNSSFAASNMTVAKVRDGYTKLSDKVSKTGSSIKNTASKLAAGASTAAGAIAGASTAFVAASTSAQNLQQSYKVTNNLLVTGGEKQAEVTKNVAQMQKDGEKISLKYGKSQQEIAEAYQDLVKRGDTSKQALGSMNSMVQASVASGDDLKDVTQVTSNVMESFGLKVDSTGKKLTNTKEITKRTKDTVNSLAYAADMTSTNFQDLGVGMSYVGATAKTSGQSVSMTASALGILSNNGLEADKAGTGLRKALNSLTSPTAQATSALKSLGISTKDFTDKSGKMKSMSDIFGLLGEKTKNLSEDQKANIFHSIFGTTGQQAGLILAENAKQLGALNDQVEKAGKNNYVGELANKNMKTAQNAMKQFKMAAQDVGNTLATNMLPTVSKMAETFAQLADSKGFKQFIQTVGSGITAVGNELQKMFTYIGKNSKAFSSLATSIAKVVGEFGSGVWDAFKGVISGISGVINTLTGNANKSKSSIQNIASAFNELAKHKEAIQTLGKVFATYFAVKKFTDIATSIGKVGKSLKNMIPDVVLTKIKDFGGKTLSLLGSGMKKLLPIGKNVLGMFKNIGAFFLTNPFGIAITAIAGIITVLTELYKHNAKFRKFVNGIISSVKDWVGNTASKIKKWGSDVGKSIGNACATMKSKMSDGWARMKQTVSDGVTAITDKDSKLHDEMISKISDATGVSKKTLNSAYSTMEDYTGTWHDIMTGKWGKVKDDVVKVGNDLASTAKSLFSDLYNKLNDLTGGGLDKIKQGWDKLWTNVIDGIKSAARSVGNHVADMVNNVIKPINDMLNGVKEGVNWVLDKFGASKWSGFKIPLVHFANGGIVGDGTMAMVNDSGKKHYREMFATPDGRIGAFPKQRNLITYLPKGTQVLDGENSKMLAEMMGIPAFKGGTKDKNLFEKIFDKGKDIFEDITDIISHPIKFMEKVLTKYLHVNTRIKFASTLISHAPTFFAKQAEKWLKKMAEDFKKSMESTGGNGVSYGAANNPGGAGVARWRPVIIEAFKNLGQDNPPDWKIEKLLRQIATESGGNPNAHQGNIGDINNLRGTPAQGLLQFVPSTFAAWSRPGHNNIYSGLDQLMAAIYCLDHGGEGGWGNIGNGHGWENGGFVDKWTFGQIAEHNKPEVVIPLSQEKQGRALDLLTATVNKLNHNAGRNTVVTNNPRNDNSGLERKLDTMIGLLSSILGVNQAQLNKSDKTGLTTLYQEMSRNQSLNDYQAF